MKENEANDRGNVESGALGGGIWGDPSNLRSSVGELSLRIIEAHREFKKVMADAQFQASEAARILRELNDQP